MIKNKEKEYWERIEKAKSITELHDIADEILYDSDLSEIAKHYLYLDILIREGMEIVKEILLTGKK